ncbi:MAG: hypothetical protein IJN62_03100 [Clostridia bacterium]|nr:hypothetical protein [Clostridia bacterium]
MENILCGLGLLAATLCVVYVIITRIEKRTQVPAIQFATPTFSMESPYVGSGEDDNSEEGFEKVTAFLKLSESSEVILYEET